MHLNAATSNLLMNMAKSSCWSNHFRSRWNSPGTCRRASQLASYQMYPHCLCTSDLHRSPGHKIPSKCCCCLWTSQPTPNAHSHLPEWIWIRIGRRPKQPAQMMRSTKVNKIHEAHTAITLPSREIQILPIQITGITGFLHLEGCAFESQVLVLTASKGEELGETIVIQNLVPVAGF